MISVEGILVFRGASFQCERGELYKQRDYALSTFAKKLNLQRAER